MAYHEISAVSPLFARSYGFFFALIECVVMTRNALRCCYDVAALRLRGCDKLTICLVQVDTYPPASSCPLTTDRPSVERLGKIAEAARGLVEKET